jgi:hypothetical protein
MSTSIMGLTTKLQADYVELINGELDNIPINDIKEFHLIAQELQNIITPPPLFSSLRCFFCPTSKKESLFSTAAQDQLDYIRFCLENPQSYVKLKDDYAEYKQILKDRISAKIAEFRGFSFAEKMSYIEFQEEKHKEALPKLV